MEINEALDVIRTLLEKLQPGRVPSSFPERLCNHCQHPLHRDGRNLLISVPIIRSNSPTYTASDAAGRAYHVECARETALHVPAAHS
jgi:hypothetical protein